MVGIFPNKAKLICNFSHLPGSVVRFYFVPSFFSSLPDLHQDHPRPYSLTDLNYDQPLSDRCRTSTTTSLAQWSLPDLNHDQPRPVFAAGPQPRPSTPSVRCRTLTPMPKTMPDRMSEAMPDRMGKAVPDRITN